MQTLEFKVYTEIIMTRVTVPVGEDIGFLPGTEEEKMNPWMGALEDNLDVLNKTDDEAGEWGRAATRDLIRSRIKVKSLNFMRGRTFINKYLIIDEAQNLTPKQMKTLITRAGPGTKVVCLGNIAQIDTPYLTEGSSGPHLRRRPLQGLVAQRPRDADARRALAARRPRGGNPLSAPVSQHDAFVEPDRARAGIGAASAMSSPPRPAARDASAPEISIVVPVYNEEAGLAAFWARLAPVLDALGRRRGGHLRRRRQQRWHAGATRVAAASGSPRAHRRPVAQFRQGDRADRRPRSCRRRRGHPDRCRSAASAGGDRRAGRSLA